TAFEQLSQQRLLFCEPRMLVVLVWVHRAAERQDGVVLGCVSRRSVGVRWEPGIEHRISAPDRVGENTRPGIRLVDDRQYAHPADDLLGARPMTGSCAVSASFCGGGGWAWSWCCVWATVSLCACYGMAVGYDLHHNLATS